MRSARAPRCFVADVPWEVSTEFAEWIGDKMLVKGFVRTIPHADGYTHDTEPCTGDELRRLTAAGFGMSLYQIFRSPRQMTANHGQAAGTYAADYAADIGYQSDATLWYDCEQPRPGSDVLGCAEQWASAARGRGHDDRGTYWGANALLPNIEIPAKEKDPRIQGDRLYALKGFKRYWIAMSGYIPMPARRGPVMNQIWELALRGTRPATWRLEYYDEGNPEHRRCKRLDINGTRIDALGGRMRWMVA